jgi:hypothetical protein
VYNNLKKFNFLASKIVFLFYNKDVKLEMKKYSECGEVKLLTKFDLNKKVEDDHSNVCRKCC